MKITVRNLLVGACAALFAQLPVAAQANTLEMRSVAESPANDASGIPRPARGTSMESVRGQHGEPAETIGPVGEPPITRWIYQDYTVYFEHNRVIHSVVRPDLRATAPN